MGVNKKLLHVFVLPEDDANLRLATEFQAQIHFTRQRQMYVLDVANGWTRVLDLFAGVHVAEMRRNPKRLLVLLIDFDQDPARLDRVKRSIPGDLGDRVFVLGVWTEAEDVKPYGQTAAELARDCRDGTTGTWGGELLSHNAGEVERLRKHAASIFFPSASNMLG